MIHFKDVAVLGQPCGYIFGGLGVLRLVIQMHHT